MTSIEPVSCSFPRAMTPNSEPAYDPLSPLLQVGFGQRTFDAEGLETPGRFFSRALHWPGGASGVTIGRGYDMGGRSPEQVQRELLRAGLEAGEAALLSRAAGLKGGDARSFVAEWKPCAPVLSLQAQQSLFTNVTLPETLQDVRRILEKPDVVARYGAVAWNTLPAAAQELLFDLRYRGDYTPGTRERIQPLLVAKDWAGLREAMEDRPFWQSRGVPANRITARTEIVSEL